MNTAMHLKRWKPLKLKTHKPMNYIAIQKKINIGFATTSGLERLAVEAQPAGTAAAKRRRQPRAVMCNADIGPFVVG